MVIQSTNFYSKLSSLTGCKHIIMFYFPEEAGRRERDERELTNGIMKRGFNIPMETVPEEEQEELKAAVEDWNKKQIVKCEYLVKCPVSSVFCVVYSVVVSMQFTVH